MPSGTVVSLFLQPGPGPGGEVEHVVAVAGRGLEGDRHFGKPKRQILLISTQSLRELGIEAGVLREQITVDFPGLQGLPVGALVRAGTAVFRIEGDCAPCARMAGQLGEDPEAFIARAKGRRGMLAAVEASGAVSVGDAVEVVPGALE